MAGTKLHESLFADALAAAADEDELDDFVDDTAESNTFLRQMMDAEQCGVHVPCRVSSHNICLRCRAPMPRELDVNIGQYLPCVTRAQMFLRVIGTRINGSVRREDSEVLGALQYIEDLLTQACDPRNAEERVPVYCYSRDPEFKSRITPVLGAAELLVQADFVPDRDLQYFMFRSPAPGGYHRWTNRRAAVVLRLVREEIALLKRGERLHTAPVHDDSARMRAEFDRLLALYQRPDSFPNWDDALRWIEIRNFFLTASHITKPLTDAVPYLQLAEQAARQIEKVFMYTEQMQQHTDIWVRHLGASVMQLCHTSEDLQMANFLRKEREEGPQRAAPPGVHTDPTSPMQGHSPSMMVTRTPQGEAERQEYALALPSPSQLTREPRCQYAGLLNLAQNCFMNCLLQAYYMCPQFTDTIMRFPGRDDWQGEVPAAVKLVHRLQTVFAFLELSSSSCVNPTFVLRSVAAAHPQFNDGGQHDPHEFADSFIEMLGCGFAEGSKRGAEGSKVHKLEARLRELLHGERTEVSVGRDGKQRGPPRLEPMLHFVPLYLPQEEAHCPPARPLPPGSPTPLPQHSPPQAPPDARHVIGFAPPLSPSSARSTPGSASTGLATPPQPVAPPTVAATDDRPGGSRTGSRAGSRAGSLARRCDPQVHVEAATHGDGTAVRKLDFEADEAAARLRDAPAGPVAAAALAGRGDLVTEMAAQLGGAGCPLLRTVSELLRPLPQPPAGPASALGMLLDAAPPTAGEPRVSVYDALEQLAIDFKDEQSDAAATMISFRRLPLLLMFYIPQRTAAGGGSRTLCDFDATVHLDRYADTPQACAARDRCRELKGEEARLAAERTQHARVGSRLSALLEDSGLNPEERAALQAALAARRASENAADGALERTRHFIRNVYANLGRSSEFTYNLHAVIVHEAAAQGGHYYAYARDTVRGKEARTGGGRWLRLDDAAVTTVHRDEVFSARTRRNAYCVFYTSSRLAPAAGARVRVPATLRRVIEQEDDRRQELIAKRLSLLADTDVPSCP